MRVLKRSRLAVLAMAATAGLGQISVGTATAAAGIPGPLPLSVALTRAELPPVGAWDGPRVRPKGPADLAPPTCWPQNEQLGSVDGVIEWSLVPGPRPTYPYYYAEESQILRYADKAAASAVAARWRTAVANCAIPADPPDGHLFIQNLRRVATADGVDVWGYDDGGAGYTLPGHTGYRQFFLVQRENVLYFVRFDDATTLEPHPVIPVADTVAAVRHHLDALTGS